jgi:hypothetical protein
MKRIAFLLVCALLIPVAGYSQNREKPTMVTPPPAPNGADSANIANGVVTELTGETITVKTNAPNPMSFAIGKTIQYADKKGRKVKKQRIGPGSKVKVYFQGNEDTRTATRIVLQG